MWRKNLLESNWHHGLPCVFPESLLGMGSRTHPEGKKGLGSWEWKSVGRGFQSRFPAGLSWELVQLCYSRTPGGNNKEINAPRLSTYEAKSYCKVVSITSAKSRYLLSRGYSGFTGQKFLLNQERRRGTHPSHCKTCIKTCAVLCHCFQRLAIPLLKALYFFSTHWYQACLRDLLWPITSKWSSRKPLAYRDVRIRRLILPSLLSFLSGKYTSKAFWGMQIQQKIWLFLLIQWCSPRMPKRCLSALLFPIRALTPPSPEKWVNTNWFPFPPSAPKVRIFGQVLWHSQTSLFLPLIAAGAHSSIQGTHYLAYQRKFFSLLKAIYPLRYCSFWSTDLQMPLLGSNS